MAEEGSGGSRSRSNGDDNRSKNDDSRSSSDSSQSKSGESQSKSGSSRSKSGGNQSKSDNSRSDSGGSRSNKRKKVNPADLARTAVQTVVQFTGRRPETVLGVSQNGDGWVVTVEVVEMSRIPTSTDLLGAYVVTLDEQGEVVGYERRRRYQRGQVGGEEG